MTYGILAPVAVGAAAGIMYTCITTGRKASRLSTAAVYAVGTTFVSYMAQSRFGSRTFEAVSVISHLFIVYNVIRERLTAGRMNYLTEAINDANRLREVFAGRQQFVMRVNQRQAANNVAIVNLRMRTAPPAA
ncbi:MAG TPA: hypothetical protein VLG76_05360 [Rhabdochlamydiaceae bacterium]|nr:hypothetical protein [Rhabdochlamydiaceae bacterium]